MVALVLLITVFGFGQTTPQDTYNLGLAMVHNDSLDEAENMFEQLVKADKNNPWGYLGLGLVEKHRENRLLEARKHFKKAAKLNPQLVQAWTEWADAETEFEQYGQAANVLRDAILENPDNINLLNRFVHYVEWQDMQKKGLKTLDKMIETGPKPSLYRFKKAELWYGMHEFEKSMKILDSIDKNSDTLSETMYYALLAKNCFTMKKIQDAQDYYLTAINLIKDDNDAAYILDDIRYIMNSNEYKEYQNLPIDKKGDFFHRFWRSRDPNHATITNERIPEHFNRIEYARKHYHAYSTDRRSDVNKLRLNHSRIRFSEIIMGPELLNKSDYPDELLNNMDVDDCGLIYIRHGAPDHTIYKTDYATELFEPMEFVWKYYQNFDRKEMIFHFVQFGKNTGAIAQSLPYSFKNTWELGADYAELDPDIMKSALEWNEREPSGGAGVPADIIIPDNSSIRKAQDKQKKSIADSSSGLHYLTKRIENLIIKDITVGMETETSNYEFSQEPMNYPYYFAQFKGINGKTMIDLYYAVNGNDVELNRQDSTSFIDLKRFIGLYDQHWRERFRFSLDEKIDISINPEIWKQSSITNVMNLSLAPETYAYELQIQDKKSGKLGVYQNTILIQNFANNLQMSNLVLSGPISTMCNGQKFKKGDIYYSPHMFNAYKQGEQIGLYFEIYNLLFNDENHTKFNITCTLESKERLLMLPLEGNFKSLFGLWNSGVGSAFEYTGTTRDDKIYVNLDFPEIESGEYELVITVRDETSHLTVEKSTGVVVLSSSFTQNTK